MYKFIPQDKQYEIFQVVDTKTLQPVEMFDNVKMAKSKLFSNDIFDFENNTFTIVSSHVRNLNDIPGVLNIRVTHGRYKDKFLYLKKGSRMDLSTNRWAHLYTSLVKRFFRNIKWNSRL